MCGDDSKDFEKSKFLDEINTLKENSNGKHFVNKVDKLSNFLESEDFESLDDEHKEKFFKKEQKKFSLYQRFKNALESDLDIDPGRLLGLTDGIFGMVMTLLVFAIALPELRINNYSSFISFVYSLAPTIGVTIVAFILISSFWIYHHEFIKIKSLNLPYLWINVFFLISISFIPFTTSLIGNYSHFFLSEVLFGLNILLVNLTFIFMYAYASKRNFLEVNASKEEKHRVLMTFITIMALTIIVNLLDFYISGNFIYLFLLVPIISTVSDIAFKMKS